MFDKEKNFKNVSVYKVMRSIVLLQLPQQFY